MSTSRTMQSMGKCPACRSENVILKDVSGLLVCEKCASKRFSTKVRKRIQEAYERQEEEKRREAWRKRIDVAKRGVKLFDKRIFPDSLKAFRDYVTILEAHYNAPPGTLGPHHFKEKREQGEILLLAGVYWDMAKIYDHMKGHSAELRATLNKFIEFSINRPHNVLASEAVRKYIKSDACVNKVDFENAHSVLRNNLGKCFIAGAVFGPKAPETQSLRAFRDEYLLRRSWGALFVKAYYRTSPPLARLMARYPVLAAPFRPLLRQISRWAATLFALTLAMAAASTSQAGAAVAEPKVVFVVIDGVRSLEIQGRAKNDQGRTVSANELFPNLMAFKKKALFLPKMEISNPVGISLPAYADIFAGRRQENVVSNEYESGGLRSQYPTIFEVLKKELNLGADGIMGLSSWKPTCMLMGGNEADFFRSCGWEKGKHFKNEIYTDTRHDIDTFVEFAKEMPARHPRFIFIHLLDADVEAHYHQGILSKSGVSYGIFPYHQALREDDHYIGRIWSLLQSDAYYRGSTYLIVTTDHGRDDYEDPSQWTTHGACVKHGKPLCMGCKSVFGLIMGPGIKPQVVTKAYSHADFAPTIARLMGTEMPSAKGQPIVEAFPK